MKLGEILRQYLFKYTSASFPLTLILIFKLDVHFYFYHDPYCILCFLLYSVSFSCMQFNLDYFTLIYLLEIWIPFSAVSNWTAFNVSIKFFQFLYFSVLVFSFDVFLKHYSSVVNCFILSSTFIYTLVLVILKPTFTSANTGVIYAFIIYKNIYSYM